MNLYTASFDLKNDDKALSFAKSLDDWLSHLQAQGVIRCWRLYRQKLNLASGNHRDFLLEIEVENMAQLDDAFRALAKKDEGLDQLYRAVHHEILAADFALYRPFPDEERAERISFL